MHDDVELFGARINVPWMQRDRDDVLVADPACKLIRDEDVPLSPRRIC